MDGINNFSGLQSERSSVLQPSNLPINTTGGTAGKTSVSLVAPRTGNQPLSPFTQLMNEIQQLATGLSGSHS
jgi:hypothetical protein